MTLIEKTLKAFDELWSINFPKENWLGKGEIEQDFMKFIIRTFINQALQEQDRESRNDIFNKIEQLEYTLDTPQIDFKLKVLNILKQDETKGSN